MTPFYNNSGGGRILWLDILKATAITSMVLLHVSAVGLSETSIGSFEWHISNIFNSFCRFCVPVFIMISGAIFLSHSEKPMSKYIRRLILALIFWTIAYSLYSSIPQFFSGEFDYYRFAKKLCSPTHLWFLWMILPLYLAVPIFRAIAKDRKAIEYFLLLWIIFGILTPAFQHLPIIGQPVTLIIKQTHFYLVLEYGGYFILGYYLTNVRMPRIEKYALIYLFGGLITTITGTYFISISLNQTSELFLGYLFPTTFLTSVGIFLYFKNQVSRWKLPPQIFKIVSFISVSSLGIYTIHMFYLSAFHRIGLTYAIYNPIVSIPAICALTLALSMGSVKLIAHFLPGGKHLI